MAVKKPILRQDVEWFEVRTDGGRVLKVRLTLEGYEAIKAILDRLVAGGL